jgi:5-methylcytosine-specific restriction endonuclease McrA
MPKKARSCPSCGVDISQRGNRAVWCADCAKRENIKKNIARRSARRLGDRKLTCADCASDIAAMGRQARRCAACTRKRRSEKNAARLKERYSESPETFRAKSRQFRVEHPDRLREWRAANPQLQKAYGAKYYWENPEKHRARARASIDPERRRLYDHERRTSPAGRVKGRLYSNRRRARLRDARSPGVSAAQWQRICESFGNVCAYCCRTTTLTIDHVVPISRGGLDEPSNVVPACKSCNSSKGARLLSEWHACPSSWKGVA